MSSIRPLTPPKLLRRLPAARAYFRQHGLHMTLLRIARELRQGSKPAPRTGSAESRPAAAAAAPRTMIRSTLKTRRDKAAVLRQHIANPSTGLEISPNINPLVVSGGGVTVQYLDFCTTDQLRAQAAAKGRNPAAVPQIDYVYDPQQLISECVGGRTFDFVLSSHVVEHIPNLVGHFRDISRILNEGGIYGLIVPDMSLCFDAGKSPTTLGQLIEAFVDDWKYAPISAMIDEFRSAVWLGDKNAWSVDDGGVFFPKYRNWRQLITNVLRNPTSSKNWHGHVWRFTPETFAQLWAEIRSFGLIDLNIRSVIPTQHMDFLCVMEKVASAK
ncbi:MAG: methyltransferase domain-containing protein [Pseudomonadota bacterium]|jgi:SAM-dependent methyltransferase